jgi:exosome complex component RRP46
MRGVICAAAVGCLRPDGKLSATLVLDPSDDELPSLEGGGCFAFLFSASQESRSEVVWSTWQSSTPFDDKVLIDARNLARKGAENVWNAMKKSIGRVGNPGIVDDAKQRGY